MIKRLLGTVLIVQCAFIAFSQEDNVKSFVDDKKVFESDTFGWKKGSFFSLNFNNAQFENWAAGGQNSVSLTGVADMFAIYRKGKHTWESYAKLGYGIIKLDTNPVRKNEDNLFILSKYGYRISPKWNYASLLSIESQMFPGFDPGDFDGNLISNFFAPATGIISTGFDYKRNDNLSLYFSPITGKFTVVADQRLANKGLYGLEVADTVGGKVQDSDLIRTELGWYFKAMFQRDIMKNVNMQSRLDLFSNYENLGAIDINWETTLNMKINKYMSASVFTHLKYDEDFDTNPITPEKDIAVQFKYVLGIGLSYKLGDPL
jgi:hypothetical protein